MTGRRTANSPVSDSVRATPSRRRAPLATSTPSLPPRTRRLPQRLTDSAIGRELELSISMVNSDSDDSDVYFEIDDSDPEFRINNEARVTYTTEEDDIFPPAQPHSQVSEPPSSVRILATSAVPVEIPSTSRGSLGDLSPIAGPSGACGSSTRSVATSKRKRRLHFTSSSSSGEDIPPTTRSRSRRVGGRVRGVRGGRRGRLISDEIREPSSDPDNPSPVDSADLTLSPLSSPRPRHPSSQPRPQQQQQQPPQPPRRRVADVGPFVWTDGRDFQPDIPAFDARESGIQPEFPCTAASKMMDYFVAFFDVAVVSWIVRETNVYNQVINNWHHTTHREHSHMVDWEDVSVAEIYVWLALTMLMPHNKKHRLRDYWTTDDLLSTPIFGRYMSRDRYRDILTNLHFTNNLGPSPSDRLWKIRTILSMLLQNIRAFLRPFQKVVIDESLMLFRGRLSFIQYIPSKRHRFGIKFYVICDCQTGYVLDFVIYTGSDVDIAENDPHGFSGAVVKHLMDHFYNRNHILYTDNYYTSPLLSQFLKEHGTESCGTVRPNRKWYPAFPVTHRGDFLIRKSGPLLAMKWHDKRPVHMLTTVHKGEMLDSGRVDRDTGNPILKPDVVFDYNINMRLVDKSDMMISSIDCLRKTCKWYKKAFLHLIDICVLNAYILYTQQHQGTTVTLRQFEKTVVKELLVEYGVRTPQQQARPPAGGQLDRLQSRVWAERHFLDDLPTLASGRSGFRRCYVCMHTTRRPTRRRETRYWCTGCQVALCPGKCYSEYHTLDDI
ncbi:hypothetical protein Pmani_010902 [Petrolisthes manimaculis]|uniref:PiggyBac transposable element-derived protein domain-containing protein n=1 Tax=Petrolisthes manimaculis TaxID=1843537 RepID=A0AAE1Q0T8_9EUCA|nr:hypothetical protein Pmani_010902 [Petrolisthes manimaculis]